MNKISSRKEAFRTCRIGIIGMGAMGKGLFYQTRFTAGLDCTAIADLSLERATEVAQWMGKPWTIVSSEKEVADVTSGGILAIAGDGSIIAGCDAIDLLIESSSSVAEAGMYCEKALKNGKHVIMMNAEADLIFGPYLLELAEANGVVYSSCDGDQHGVIKQLANELTSWGFDLVMTGNIKGYLDRYSNPEKIIPEADKRRLDYRMAAAYTDGTKLNIEMSLVANALNMRTVKPGMIGPPVRDVREVFRIFDFEELWSAREPFVDYILGAEPGGGVFAIGYNNDDYQRFMMNYYKMGEGPFYLFYRPYHLCHVEAMKWIVRAWQHGESLLKPDYGFKTNVMAYAKKDLLPGDRLDGIGGFCCYGLIENQKESDSSRLPVCLAENAVVKSPVSKDSPLFFGDVEFMDPDSGPSMYEKAVKASENRAKASFNLVFP